MLQIKDLCFLYGDNTMAYNLEIQAGECIALIGPSGGGKTTLLNLIAGFLPPHSGRILFKGQGFTNLPPDQRPLTILFQEHNLFPHLTVTENIGIGLHPGLRLSDAHKQSITEAIENVELGGMENRLPKELSGGQRQRVALARSLVRQQPLLLLDEPFSALDPGLRLQMLNLVRKLQAEKGLTVLMASHNPEDSKLIADRVAYIDSGKIAVHGHPESVFTNPILDGYLGKTS